MKNVIYMIAILALLSSAAWLPELADAMVLWLINFK